MSPPCYQDTFEGFLHQVCFTLEIVIPYNPAASQGVIGPGGVQWMTAGRGIIHRRALPAQSVVPFGMHCPASGGPMFCTQALSAQVC